MSYKIEEINQAIRDCADTNQISDGYHTFGELYEHRIALFIALCHVLADANFQAGYLLANKQQMPWKSRMHHDGTHLPGWFIAGIGTFEEEQISYHLPDSKWDALHVRELEKAPEWDRHTPADVVKRLLELSGGRS